MSPSFALASLCCGGIFDYAGKKERLAEIELELSDAAVWEHKAQVKALTRERSNLHGMVQTLDDLDVGLADAAELTALAAEDASILADVQLEVARLQDELAALEFKRMFSGAMDVADAFVEIKPGAGGVEAQDWANMLLRMYVRWGAKSGLSTEIMHLMAGDVAGIRGAMIRFNGLYAYGWLRTEMGIHRLVRNSPFNAENKRHTSFASVFVSPEVEDDIAVELDMSKVRVDTYRASGAGGQHVNKTDSAVRLTHVPTGVVVQCQNERSQHKNKEWAVKLLRSKLYEIEEQKRLAAKQAVEDSKLDIGWGNQIRSYVLDQSRVKDHRTQTEHGNPDAVLDGDLDTFLQASLKAGL